MAWLHVTPMRKTRNATRPRETCSANLEPNPECQWGSREDVAQCHAQEDASSQALSPGEVHECGWHQTEPTVSLGMSSVSLFKTHVSRDGEGGVRPSPAHQDSQSSKDVAPSWGGVIRRVVISTVSVESGDPSPAPAAPAALARASASWAEGNPEPSRSSACAFTEPRRTDFASTETRAGCSGGEHVV